MNLHVAKCKLRAPLVVFSTPGLSDWSPVPASVVAVVLLAVEETEGASSVIKSLLLKVS